jgi:hypothetical protein
MGSYPLVLNQSYYYRRVCSIHHFCYAKLNANLIKIDPSTEDTMASLYEKTVASRATNERSLPNSMNRRWQESLPEPWSNYQLVITQRLKEAGDKCRPD